MGISEQSRRERVDAWLAQGGQVLASTDRAARAVVAAFDAARHAEGRLAWPSPSIFTWESWVRERWLERNDAGLMLLNPLQEQELWARVIRGSRAGADLLHSGRLASAAQVAYRLLCGYAPGALNASSRLGWAEYAADAAIFSDWLAEFESRCRREGLVSASRLPLYLTELLRSDSRRDLPEHKTPGLLLIGFDRLLETQEALLDAWGPWQRDERDPETQDREIASARFLAARDGAAEVQACAGWLRERIKANPRARLMVVTSGLAERRGELERALLAASAGDDAENGSDWPELDFEFSLGVPLGRVGLVRSAILLLRWLVQPISEPELDWLLSSGFCAGSAEEEIALCETMLKLRSRGLERPEWGLGDFAVPDLPEFAAPEFAPPSAWVARLLAARGELGHVAQRQSALQWAGLAGQLLETAGWPGFRPFSSTAFQARRRWEQVLEQCASLGFDGSQMEWTEFVSTVASAVSDTIFATESTNAPIQITEPLASAGQLADGIWFLGAHEQNWPGRGQPHPLLPIGLQRDAGMPHASPQADWTLAQEVTTRLLASADEVIFSYARQAAEAETRPSRMVTQLIGEAEDIPEAWSQAAGLDFKPLTEVFEDTSRVRFPLAAISGGAATLTRQSLCPFQAFAMARLGSVQWEPAEAGLNAKQRGQLLHAVLHRVWAGAGRGGISSLAELQRVSDLTGFVREVVKFEMGQCLTPGGRNSLPARFPARLIELEAERLTGLVTEWLEYERLRQPFTVAKTEDKAEVTIAGMTLRLRLDRIDELADGSQLVIDYKSGDVGPSAWLGERPDDVQLPLYAEYAVKGELQGLVFGRVRRGDAKFLGRVRNASSSLMAGLHPTSALVRDPLTDWQLAEWRERIERLGEDFLAGKADVDPKDNVKVCGNCHLHAVCRIYENQPLAAFLGEEGGDESESRADNGGGDA